MHDINKKSQKREINKYKMYCPNKSILNSLSWGLKFLIGTQTVLFLNFIGTINDLLCNFLRTIWICYCCGLNSSGFSISTFLVKTYIVFVTVLVDFDTPPDPPNEELLNVLELKPPPIPLPNPSAKKSLLSNIEENPKPPFLPFLPKNELNKSASSSSSKPKSSKKCLKMSFALWKLKLVPCFGASKPKES